MEIYLDKPNSLISRDRTSNRFSLFYFFIVARCYFCIIFKLLSIFYTVVMDFCFTLTSCFFKFFMFGKNYSFGHIFVFPMALVQTYTCAQLHNYSSPNRGSWSEEKPCEVGFVGIGAFVSARQRNKPNTIPK